MSEAKVTVRFDGDALKTHQMDVADLAPALLGISELCKIANRKFNGERAAVKVLIATDSEHKCFQFDLHVVQSLWEHTRSILVNDEVKSAKDFLDWLGILTGVPGVFGLFQLLKRLGGKKITSTALETNAGRDVVRITIDGDDNNVVIVYPQTLELLMDERITENAKRAVEPITKPGYDRVEFESDGQVTETVDRDDAAAITNAARYEPLVPETDQPQSLTVWISVYSPVYDKDAINWRFKFGEGHDYMDISETTIAADAIRRGGAMVDDSYRVVLEVSQEHKQNGVIVNHYKIKEVLEFRAARLPFQSDAFR